MTREPLPVAAVVVLEHHSPIVGVAVTPCRGNVMLVGWRRRDCEDRLGSLMVMGCGLATASVTHAETGFVPLVRLVRSQLPAPARPKVLA